MPSIENWIDTEMESWRCYWKMYQSKYKKGSPIPQKGKGELLCNLGSITPQCNDRKRTGFTKMRWQRMPFLNIFFGADFGQIPLIFDKDFERYLNFCPPKRVYGIPHLSL